MGMPQGSEWILIVIVVVLLFGAKKLPEAARGLGRSLRIFKSEVKQINDPVDDGTATGATAVTPTTAAIAATPVQAVQVPMPAPAQAPAQTYVPVQPVAEPTQVAVDPTNVEAVNERFYGEERSDR